MNREENRQMAVITSGTAEVIPQEELRLKIRRSLEKGIPLRVKMGIDPTTPDVHLGHMVAYRKIRQFQDLGHKAVLIIGDYTARIGDPTGRNAERPPLTEDQVKRNSENYTSQIFKIVDKEKTEVLYQSSWFDKVSLQETLTAVSAFSAAHMLTHETFRNRIESGCRLSLHEMLYPVLQAWDSVFVNSDVELGGMDQKFNILCGRDLQKSRGLEPQAALFMPLLSGTDGRKMSKSFGNHVAVISAPEDKFGKIMSISDNLISEFFLLAAGKNDEEIQKIEKRLTSENPRDVKLELASEIVGTYHGREAAARARENFLKVFSRREMPDSIPELKTDAGEELLLSLLKKGKAVSSTREGRRLILQGGIQLDGQKISDPETRLLLPSGHSVTVRIGKRRFLKLVGE